MPEPDPGSAARTRSVEAVEWGQQTTGRLPDRVEFDRQPEAPTA